MTGRAALLLVKDREDEFPLYAQEAEKLGIRNPFRAVQNIEQLRRYLEGTGVYRNRELFPVPGLILLDLDSKFNGVETFLQWLRNSSTTPHVRVVGVKSAGDDEREQRLRAAGLNALLPKPATIPETWQLVQKTELVQGVLAVAVEAPQGKRPEPAQPVKRKSKPRWMTWFSDLLTSGRPVRREKYS